MQHCSSCFNINAGHDSFCRKCGATITEGDGSVAITEHLDCVSDGVMASPEAHKALSGRAKGQVSRSLMYLLGLALLFPVPMLLNLDWDSLDAQPARIVEPQLELPHDLRKADIEKAAEALQNKMRALEQFVKVRDTLSASEQESRLADWSRDVEVIKSEYRIWGIVDAQHPDAVAEDSLRNALLYIHSLKHVASKTTGGQESSDFQRLRGSFETSIAAALGR